MSSTPRISPNQRLRTTMTRLTRAAPQWAVLVWAVVMGVLGALATLLFFELVHALQWLAMRQRGSIDAVVAQYSTWQSLLYPTLAGLIGALLLVWASRVSTDTSADYMEAVALGDGRLSMAQGGLRVVSSALVVTSGFSIGREGPMIHLGAMFSSALGRFFFMDTQQLRLVVACGAAGAVAAAYHTPLAGALFVAEIVLGSLSMPILGPLLIAAMSAYLTTIYLDRHVLLYEVSGTINLSLELVASAVIVGVAAGVLSPLFLRALDSTKKLLKRLPLSVPVLMALAGLVMGLFLLYDPRLAGNGDSILHTLINVNEWTWQVLLIFLTLKVIATLIAVGSGAVGGVLTPIMFIGAAVSLVVLKLATLVFSDLGLAHATFVIFGMGAFLAAATNAPLMAIIMMVEMSNNHAMVVPVVFACVTATYVARQLNGTMMYSVSKHREDDIRLRYRLSQIQVAQLMKQAPHHLIHEQTTVREALSVFSDLNVRYLYVVTQNNEYRGVVAHRDLSRNLLSGATLDAPLPEQLILRTHLEPLTPDMNLDQVQARFVAFDGERLPVVDHQETWYLVGIVYKSDVLRRYSEIKASLDRASDSSMNPFLSREG